MSKGPGAMQRAILDELAKPDDDADAPIPNGWHLQNELRARVAISRVKLPAEVLAEASADEQTFVRTMMWSKVGTTDAEHRSFRRALYRLLEDGKVERTYVQANGKTYAAYRLSC